MMMEEQIRDPKNQTQQLQNLNQLKPPLVADQALQRVDLLQGTRYSCLLLATVKFLFSQPSLGAG